MMKILFQVKNLSLKKESMGKLYNASISFFGGMIYSLAGLDYSGRDIFLKIIKGNIDEKKYEGVFFVDNKLLNSAKKIKEYIYIFSLQNKIIDDWTVAEYIYLREGKWFLSKNNLRNMIKRIEVVLGDFGLDISGSKKVGELGVLTRYQIEFIRAIILNKKIIIIEDEFTYIELFSKWLKSNLKEDMTIILNTYSQIASYKCSDIFVCFKKGCIVKICRKDSIGGIDKLYNFIVGSTMNEKISSLSSGYTYNKLHNGNDEVYSVSGNFFGKNIETYSFAKGKIYSFIIEDHNNRYRFFEAISGADNKDKKYFIERYYQEVIHVQDLIVKKIISVDGIGERDFLAENMSIEDNLILPSLNKISNINYLINQYELKRVIFEELKSKDINKEDLVSELDINQKICVSLERWLIFRPKVFIIFEPFIYCDNYGLSLIKNYLKKFAKAGTTVIVIKSRLEYIEDISDEIISI